MDYLVTRLRPLFRSDMPCFAGIGLILTFLVTFCAGVLGEFVGPACKRLWHGVCSLYRHRPASWKRESHNRGSTYERSDIEARLRGGCPFCGRLFCGICTNSDQICPGLEIRGAFRFLIRGHRQGLLQG